MMNKRKRSVKLHGQGNRAEFFDREYMGRCKKCGTKAIKVTGSSLTASGIRFRMPNERRCETIVYCNLCSELLAGQFIRDKEPRAKTRRKWPMLKRFSLFSCTLMAVGLLFGIIMAVR